MKAKSTLQLTYRWVRRVVVAVIGTTVLLLGIALLFLPGPAFIVIPAGLAILSLEFAWARRWLQKAKDQANKVFEERPYHSKVWGWWRRLRDR